MNYPLHNDLFIYNYFINFICINDYLFTYIIFVFFIYLLVFHIERLFKYSMALQVMLNWYCLWDSMSDDWYWYDWYDWYCLWVTATALWSQFSIEKLSDLAVCQLKKWLIKKGIALLKEALLWYLDWYIGLKPWFTLVMWIIIIDYCDVFISCLDSHSDGTHSQHCHRWASDVMLNISKSILIAKQTHFHLGCPESEYIFCNVS